MCRSTHVIMIFEDARRKAGTTPLATTIQLSCLDCRENDRWARSLLLNGMHIVLQAIKQKLYFTDVARSSAP